MVRCTAHGSLFAYACININYLYSEIMPFNSSPISLEDFRPDANFDEAQDLVRVEFENQHLYVSSINGMWGVRSNDPTMSPSMLERFAEIKLQLPRTPGLKVDSAVIGSVALFSAANYDWLDILKSEQPVTGFLGVRREDIDVSTAVLLENR